MNCQLDSFISLSLEHGKNNSNFIEFFFLVNYTKGKRATLKFQRTA